MNCIHGFNKKKQIRLFSKGLVISLSLLQTTAYSEEFKINAPQLPVTASCNVIPPNGFPAATNQRHYYLSEVGGCDKLKCFLNDVENSPHSNATLVIDQLCTLKEPIRIPHRFTLAGVGINGEGGLVFQNLPTGTGAINLGHDDKNTHITLRDLSISYAGLAPDNVIGLNVANSHIVSIENIRISDFGIGIYGSNAFSIFIDHSNISNNGNNVVLGDNTTAWRIRDSVMNQAKYWSVTVNSKTNDHLIDGVRFESNGINTGTGGAVRTAGFGIRLINNRFESNGGNIGIFVANQANQTRILTNLFSSDVVVNQGQDTECAHNISLDLQNLGC